MSRAPRRPATHSRGSSSHGHRSLSVTEAVQSIRLTETVGEHNVNLPSSYATSTSQRRPSHRDESGAYEQSPYKSTSYSSSTLDPSVLDSSDYPTYSSHQSYSEQPTSTTSYLSGTPATMSYPSYSSAPLSSPYRPSLSSRSPSQYGKLRVSSTAHLPSRRPLNEAGYNNPSTEASMSRSMSGPSLPSIPPRAYDEVRNVGREFVERRRHQVHKPRRQRKILVRQAVLPSTSRSSQAEDVSGSIDSFLAPSGSSYGTNSPYATPSSHGVYGNPTTRSPYDSSYAAPYGGGSGTSPYTSTSRGYTTTTPAYDHGNDRRPSGPALADPVVLETPSKPQCWDHGCNGRQFSTFSNLLRHQREKSGSSTKSVCHRCGAEFTRKTARDGHLAHDKCKQKSPGR